MPALSKAQRRLMAIGEHSPSELYPENKGILKMGKESLHDFAATSEAGLPKKAVSKLYGKRGKK